MKWIEQFDVLIGFKILKALDGFYRLILSKLGFSSRTDCGETGFWAAGKPYLSAVLADKMCKVLRNFPEKRSIMIENDKGDRK